MKAQVYGFNGIWGFAIGEDGNIYFLHESEIQCEEVHKRSVRNQLSSARAKRTLEIEFDSVLPPENSGRYPKAKNFILKRSPGWRPQNTSDGFWLQAGPERSDFRCSSCGNTNFHQTKFCPYCGVPMTREPDEGGYKR